MSPDRRLQEKFRGLAEALYPDDVLRQERAVSGALNADGTVRTDAITAALPWQRLVYQIDGVAVVGPSRGGIYDLPHGGVIRSVRAHARTAPSSGPFTFLLVVNGTATSYTASIQPGGTSETSGAHIAVPAGQTVTVNVLESGGAEDITISVFYAQGGTT